MNPVFLFGWIDKMASDMRGDPASAMLEVLDQSRTEFRDHYLESALRPFGRAVHYHGQHHRDHRPGAAGSNGLIEVPSYTLEEKVQLPDAICCLKLEAHGLKAQLKLSEKAFSAIIDSYTRRNPACARWSG